MMKSNCGSAVENGTKPNGVRELTRIALLVAMLSVSSYIAFPVPFSHVPIVAQTLVINLIALLLTPRQAFKTVAIFLAVGAMGMPVFARGSSGLGALVGPSGGFFVGYLVAVVVMSKLKELSGGQKSLGRYLLITLAGVPIIYIFGALWLGHVLSLNLRGVLAAAVLPFVPGDIFKCLVASLLMRALDKAIKR